MKNPKVRQVVLPLITALIWGSAFVTQSLSAAHLGCFSFNALRAIPAVLVLLVLLAVMQRIHPREKYSAEEKRALLRGGLVCGAFLALAINLQQFGMGTTSAGKAGFITTLYIAFVPIISIFMRKRVRPIMWICVLLGAVGFYLLCMTEASLKLEFGDMLVLLCAAAFAIHIQIIDYYSPKGDGIKISCVQFLFAGVLGLICMAIFETPDLGNILACWLPILYAGVLSCGIGYTLQVVAQADADPTAASLILSLESAFAAISGALVLHESMTLRQLFGCAVIFCAVILSNLPEKQAKLPNEPK
ncbi:MAG: DMT family transporter [Clostridiales bacterium]|nr:DMT family transporter [Clostridiales bacterium]